MTAGCLFFLLDWQQLCMQGGSTPHCSQNVIQSQHWGLRFKLSNSKSSYFGSFYTSVCLVLLRSKHGRVSVQLLEALLWLNQRRLASVRRLSGMHQSFENCRYTSDNLSCSSLCSLHLFIRASDDQIEVSAAFALVLAHGLKLCDIQGECAAHFDLSKFNAPSRVRRCVEHLRILSVLKCLAIILQLSILLKMGRLCFRVCTSTFGSHMHHLTDLFLGAWIRMLGT